ncbi:uncharacterized protein [Miscanthus floridulus]|uniref:uncharacterized protein isoform X1 n=1 Tax=Miscanthus floridulus TaxID=154761 RepID=UPI003458557E
MLLHEAMALLQLHAQAVAVNNIRNHVTIVLDVDSGNFNRWRDQFLLILGKFSLQDHVHEEPPAPISPDWARMDCVVKSWIVATLTDDLAEIIFAQGSTARHAWLAVESQFLGNREARSIHLETRFRNFVQGDLSVTDYCRRLKKMADDLTALGEVITDRTLVLNVICGLNECFSHVGALLCRSRPFPTFLEACDDLILEELTLENKESPATALAASTAAAGSSSHEALSKLASSVSCHIQDCSDLCHACQLGRMFVCSFIRPPLVSLASLILFIVTCGHLQLSVFLVTNTIWSYLMIALTACGLFLCDSNLTLTVRLPTSSPTPPPNLAPTSRLSSVTTGKSLTTLAPVTSSSPRASIFACPTPTLCLKMVKSNALFAPSIMSFAHCSFRRLCLPPIGRRPSPQ